MILLNMKNSKVLVYDVKRKLFLRDTPLYRGHTRWNSFKDQAMKFDTMAEAIAAVDATGDKDLDIVYELESEEEDKGKEGRRFEAEISMNDAYTRVYWNAKDEFEILDKALMLAQRTKSDLLSVCIKERESIIP